MTDNPETPVIGVEALFPEIEGRLGLPSGIFARLEAADDWTFVLQLCAMAEIALTHLIDAELRHPGMRELVGRLSIGGQFGKRAIALSLGLISPAEAKAVDALAEIRAAYAHDLTAMTLSLAGYFGSLGAAQRESAIARIAGGFAPNAAVDANAIMKDFVLNVPRDALRIFVLLILFRAFDVDEPKLAARLDALIERELRSPDPAT